MKPLFALRTTPPAPAAGAPGRRPALARRGPARLADADDAATDTPFGQMVAEVARGLAALSAARRAGPDGPGGPTGPDPAVEAGADEQAAEAAVIAALCDRERRRTPQRSR